MLLLLFGPPFGMGACACVCATQDMTTPKFEESLCNSFQIYRTQQFISTGQTNGSQLEVKWRAVCEKYNLVHIRASAVAVAQTNQDFAFSNYDGNKNKTLDGKQWAGENEAAVGARARAQTRFVLTRHMKNIVFTQFFLFVQVTLRLHVIRVFMLVY